MSALLVLIGLAEGLAVGGAFVALVTVLRVVPRLQQVCGGQIRGYEVALAAGACLGAADEAFAPHLGLGGAWVGLAGFLGGAFVGLLAAAVAEIAAVLPLAGRRLGIGRWLMWLVLALALGKTLGAVLWWSVPSLWNRPPA